MPKITINNVKISVKTPLVNLSTIVDVCKERQIQHKLYNNFISVKTHNFSYIIFKRRELLKKGCLKLPITQHVNITRITSLPRIFAALKELCKLMRLLDSNLTLKWKTDCISATTKLKKKIDIATLATNSDYSDIISYSPDVFPGAKVKTGSGSCILFKSGKIVIVGSKSRKELKEALFFICKLCAVCI